MVRPPADLAAALRKVPGALPAFAALSPSHRRELLRYVDDARTPQARARRIEKAVDHSLGRPVPAAGGAARRALWTCPRCGNEFVNRNQYHSCRRLSLDDPFKGKPPAVRDLFERFRALVLSCGPVKMLPYRDRVGFMVRVRFAAAIPKARWLDVGFWLPRRIEHPRVRKIETIYPYAHVHPIRIERPDQIDGQLAAWVREAYGVGCQEHLRQGR